MKSEIEDKTIEHMMHVLLPDLVKEVSGRMKKANLEISPNTIIKILSFAMEAVEQCPVKGRMQKDLAIKIVIEIANVSGLSPENIEIIKSIAEGELISSTIDLVIDAAKGNINVNNVEQVATNCFSKILGCLFKRNNRTPEITIPEPDLPFFPPKTPKNKKTPETPETPENEKQVAPVRPVALNTKEHQHPEKATVRPVTPPSPVIKRNKPEPQPEPEPEPTQEPHTAAEKEQTTDTIVPENIKTEIESEPEPEPQPEPQPEPEPEPQPEPEPEPQPEPEPEPQPEPQPETEEENVV